MSRSIVLAIALVLALPATALAGHDTQYQWGEAEYPALKPAMANVKPPQFVDGPCTDAARRGMPAAQGHDHLSVGQHKFSCRAQQTFFDPLDKVLDERPIVTGEMDVKKNLMVIATAYPESGFLLYDIAEPTKPKLLSRYRGEECEQVVLDVDCGAYVDLSPDGTKVFMSVQQITVLAPPSAQMRPLAAYPGLEVIDISDPSAPLLRQALPIESTGGVHTARSFQVPDAGGDGPREPGTYVVAVANGMGLSFEEVTPAGLLAPVSDVELAESHDMFIQEDPILKRTLLYVAGGFDTGFYVFDVTAPSAPVLLSEWDPTPECSQDWYAHTIDVAVRGSRRFVTMPNELIDFFGEQADDPGCGGLAGNGDASGPMWIVDAGDLARLGPADTAGNGADAEGAAELKAASEATLVTYWSNAAKRAGGELTFSPHNQQIVGDKIYLSQYHGGVVVLDAKEAFEGRNVRPRETALFVPSEGPQRDIPPDAGATTPAFDYHFVTGFIDYRPLVWDMTYANGYVFIPDMTGGLTVVKEDDSPGAAAGGGTPRAGSPCVDRTAPRSRITRARLSRRGVRVRGRVARGKGCGKVARVAVAVGRKAGRKCRFVSSGGRLEKARSCRKPIFVTAKGRGRFTFRKKVRLPRGRYIVLVRATDTAGNREKPRGKARRARRL